VLFPPHPWHNGNGMRNERTKYTFRSFGTTEGVVLKICGGGAQQLGRRGRAGDWQPVARDRDILQPARCQPAAAGRSPPRLQAGGAGSSHWPGPSSARRPRHGALSRRNWREVASTHTTTSAGRASPGSLNPSHDPVTARPDLRS